LDEPSVITIGGYDAEKYATEDLKWHDLINKFWWTLKLDGVKLGGEDLPIRTSQVIIDTGTSFTLVPNNDFRVIQGYFLAKGFDC